MEEAERRADGSSLYAAAQFYWLVAIHSEAASVRAEAFAHARALITGRMIPCKTLTDHSLVETQILSAWVRFFILGPKL